MNLTTREKRIVYSSVKLFMWMGIGKTSFELTEWIVGNELFFSSFVIFSQP